MTTEQLTERIWSHKYKNTHILDLVSNTFEHERTRLYKCMMALSVSAEGCPGLCNSNGRCTLDQNGWHCVCQPGWRGAGCDVAMETLCADGKDNEGGEVTGDWTDERYKI